MEMVCAAELFPKANSQLCLRHLDSCDYACGISTRASERHMSYNTCAVWHGENDQPIISLVGIQEQRVTMSAAFRALDFRNICILCHWNVKNIFNHIHNSTAIASLAQEECEEAGTYEAADCNRSDADVGAKASASPAHSAASASVRLTMILGFVWRTGFIWHTSTPTSKPRVLTGL